MAEDKHRIHLPGSEVVANPWSAPDARSQRLPPSLLNRARVYRFHQNSAGVPEQQRSVPLPL